MDSAADIGFHCEDAKKKFTDLLHVEQLRPATKQTTCETLGSYVYIYVYVIIGFVLE